MGGPMRVWNVSPLRRENLIFFSWQRTEKSAQKARFAVVFALLPM